MSPLSVPSSLLPCLSQPLPRFAPGKLSSSPPILLLRSPHTHTRTHGFKLLPPTSLILLPPTPFRPRLLRRRLSRPSASWIATSQIASQAFTWGTVAVLPFYTLMVLAPNSKFTRRTMQSSAPYVLLGMLYAYLLYLSWTPETLKCMFASKYWLPELHGIARMFSNEMTVASAWIHLLAVDLFAARQVFHDGLRNNVETRHSVSLCLLFCPIGIISHAITKVLAESVKHQQ